MSDETPIDEAADEPGDEPGEPRRLDTRDVQVDGGDLPKFDATFEVETWETEEGPVVGVRYDGPEVPSGAERVAYVRAAMEHSD